MEIPLGNFGTTTPGRVSPGTAGGDFGQGVGQAVQRLGQTITGVMDEREQRKHEMARAKAVNDTYKHDLFAMEKVDEVEKKIRSGELKYQDAESYFNNQVNTFAREKIDGLDPADAEQFDGLIARNAARNAQKVKGLVFNAEKQDYTNQFMQGLDTLGKQRQLPGADFESINAKADVLSEMAKRAGIPEAAYKKNIQDFKDSGWYQHASEKAMRAEASDDVQALKQLQHDLTAENGYYTTKMDTDKRNAVLKGVTFDLDRIRQRQEMAAARAEVKAERALVEFDKLVMSGENPNSEAISNTLSAVQGTHMEAEFQDRLKFAENVQKILSMPVQKQIEFAAELTANREQGVGSLREAAQSKKLVAAIQKNIMTRTQDPLKYAASKTNMPIEPLPIEALSDMSAAPAAAQAIAARLQERAEIIGALEKEDGIKTDNALLLSDEVKSIASLLGSQDAAPSEKRTVLNSLKLVSGSPEIFKSVMAQVMPKQPVLAYAGIYSAIDRDIKYSSGLFGGNTRTIKPDEVVDTILKGDTVLSDNKFLMPTKTKFQERFAAKYGEAYRDAPNAYQADLQAVRAYFAGAVSERGAPSKEIDDNGDLFEEAMSVVAGATYDSGDSTVIAPVGMSDSEFADRIESAWAAVSDRYGGLPLSAYSLLRIDERKYRVMSGLVSVPDKNGKPLELDVGE